MPVVIILLALSVAGADLLAAIAGRLDIKAGIPCAAVWDGAC